MNRHKTMPSARPGEVLVSQAVADAAQEELEFLDIAQVELKGVSGSTRILRDRNL